MQTLGEVLLTGGFRFQVVCSSFSTIYVEPSEDGNVSELRAEKFAYGKTGFEKRNKEADGLFYLKTVHLPDQLEKNLKQYLKSKLVNFVNWLYM